MYREFIMTNQAAIVRPGTPALTQQGQAAMLKTCVAKAGMYASVKMT